MYNPLKTSAESTNLLEKRNNKPFKHVLQISDDED
jgi:hypothetical protein